MTIWRMRISGWIPKATNTHSECTTLTAFPLQQWLYERAFMLRYTYIACIVDKLIITHLVDKVPVCKTAHRSILRAF
jgi:hypothetical protein